MPDFFSDRQTPPEPPGRGGRGPRPTPRLTRGLFFWLILFLGAVFFYQAVREVSTANVEEISLSEFRERMNAGRVEEVRMRRTRLTGIYGHVAEGQPTGFTCEILEEASDDVMQWIAEHNDRVERGEATGRKVRLYLDPGGEFLKNFFQMIAPGLILLLVLWFFLGRMMRSSSGGVLAFGKSRARLVSKEHTGVTFEDVAGIEEAKEEVVEIVEYLKNPSKFHKLGGRIPRGVLLVGPPGTGKTLLAKAISGEADVPFFSISGSDFVEMFVGVGASRVRDLFKQAKDNAPCIIFLDEIDAVGRRRGAGLGGGHDEREQTLNAILVEMDGFERDESVIVIAATNRPDVLDPALLRPGRFDRQVVVDMPDIRGRRAILEIHARKYKLAPEVDLMQVARGTPNFSGADLEAIMNEAALMASRRGKPAIEQEDLEEARDKIHWGRQKRSRVMEEEDRRITAVHESGHALIAKLLPEVEPVHKVTIIPQGMSLGATLSLPEKDRYHVKRTELLGTICMMLGGRVAEELVCKDITSGAQNDIERATHIARAMVCQWGMSDDVGPLSFEEDEETIFLGREITRHRGHSEATAIRIDEEIKRIVMTQYERARRLIKENQDRLMRIAEALLTHETLHSADLDRLLAGETLPPPIEAQPGPAKEPPPAPLPGRARSPEGPS